MGNTNQTCQKNAGSASDTLRTEMDNRNKLIVKVSITGIITNIFLVIFKITIGLLSSSISVILDGINNLTDVISSIVTIVGTKLADKKPDKKHPLGHGRIEYIATMIVAAIILYAGVTAGKAAIESIFEPQEASYHLLSLFIIAVGVLAKVFLGTYVIKKGKITNSGALIGSGKDALYDSILSGSVLVCAIINFITGWKLESYVGVIVAIFIIRAGLEMMIETLDEILGKRADPETAKLIKEVICEHEHVMGAYDLFLNNYGPNRNYASVHIELPDTMTVEEVDVLTREIERDVYIRTGVILTGVGVYSFNTKDDEATAIRNKVSELVMANEWALQMHGFFVDVKKKTMRFDVVLSFDITQKEGVEILHNTMQENFPEYQIMIVPDLDITD